MPPAISLYPLYTVLCVFRPSIETELNAKITSLQSSLEASEKEAQAKVRLESELNQKQENITQQQTAIDKLQDELSSRG